MLPSFRCQYMVDNLKLEWSLGSQKCQNSWTCADNASDVTNLCACDDVCKTYDDCCLDVDQDLDLHRDTFVSCQYIPEIKEKTYVYIVQTCPDRNDNGDLKTLCENGTFNDDITIRTPVSSVKTGLLYKNMYCAMCHHEDYITWRSGIDCTWRIDYYDRNYSLAALRNDSNCRIVFEPPPSPVGLEPRECLPLIDTCEETSNERCQAESRALVFGNTIYKNIHCALCNGEVLANLSCDPYSVNILPKNPNKRKPINYSYRLLVDLNALTSTGVSSARRASDRKDQRDLSDLCTDSWIFDPLAETCRQIFCVAPFVYKDRRCKLPSWEDTNNTKTRDEEQHMSCPFVRLNHSEYKIVNLDQVFVLSSGFIYSKNDSYIGEGFALVCVQELGNQSRLPESDSITLLFTSVESVLSVVCQCLSIVALSIGLTIYACFPKLQNIPGKNLICLMASLLLAQVLFILAPLFIDITHLCTLVAIVMHYAYLAAFFWMNVMAIDIFLTFSKGFAQSRTDSLQHFVWYSLYSWLAPAAIVCVAIIFDFTAIESDSKPKYGAVVCWISNSFALLYFFLVPLFALVFTNIVLFQFTARAIYVSDKETSRILKKRQTCKLLIYLKLSSVMGFTWGFACVAIFLDLPPFWYLFIIFNALQGVLVFLSFVCSTKVLRLLKSTRFCSCLKVCPTLHDIRTNSSNDRPSKSNRTVMSSITIKSSGNSESAC
ncbi:uncharacterized protein LOC117323248 [Pecten maximus]|uniref:uncharacterized protein LOC117323248 n=1 Tax=Pecten maximus TaxID=6579 RepID=UPI00145893BE|nr:uncharacterized protein LOC117323248 [Pecten maximus]